MTKKITIAVMAGKVINIVSGWGKSLGLIPTSKAEAKLSELRLEKCERCVHAKTSRLMEILNGQASFQNKLVCTMCHCPCLEKSLVVDEQCPVKKW